MSNTNVDFVGKGQSQGEVAGALGVNGRLDPNSMRPYIGADGRPYMTVFKGGDPLKPENYEARLVNHGTLRRDEWKSLDEAVLGIAEHRLRGIADLENRGLVYNLGDGMATTVLEYHDISDALEAEMSMDGIARGQNDRPVYSTNYLPIPIVHVDYEINARVLAASRKMGNPIDTTLAERAARRVAETLEKMLFTDTSYAFGGGTIYSYLNFPHRNEVSFENENWTHTDTTGQHIVEDCIKLKQEMLDNYQYGDYVIYIPPAYETKLDGDYDNTRGNTVRERILAIDKIADIKVIDTLPANNILMVQMSSDTVRLVKGMGIQNVEWEQEGRFITKNKVMTIQVPQIRADANNKCGIVHMS